MHCIILIISVFVIENLESEKALRKTLPRDSLFSRFGVLHEMSLSGSVFTCLSIFLVFIYCIYDIFYIYKYMTYLTYTHTYHHIYTHTV